MSFFSSMLTPSLTQAETHGICSPNTDKNNFDVGQMNLSAPNNFWAFLPQVINLLLTKREGHTGEYWPKVVAVQTKHSEVRTKNNQGPIFPSMACASQVSILSSLLHGTWAMLVLHLPAFENKKYTAYDRFHGNGPQGEIPTKKEPIKTLGFALPYNNNY